MPKSRFPTWRQYHDHRRKFLKPLLDALEAMTIPLPGLRPIVDEAVKNIAAMQAARIARAKRTARPDVPETDFGIMGVGESACCEHCNDGDGFCAFPHYGAAPHKCYMDISPIALPAPK